MESIVKELVARDGQRKVQIIRRDDRSCGFRVLQFGPDPLEMRWLPYGRFSTCIAASEEAAEREARGR